MPTPTNSLAIANLAVFLLLLPFTLYSLFRHGRHGFLGWAYLFGFALLRITGAGLQLSNSSSSTAAVINGVGLSPLLMAFVGVLHECSHYIRVLFPANSGPVVVAGNSGGHIRKEDPLFLLSLVPYILIHLVVGIALALVVVGATATPNPELGKERAGYFVFLIVFVVVGAFVGLAWRGQRLRGGWRDANVLLYTLTLCLPFLLVRIVYSLAASFDSSINPETGPIGYRIVLQVLMEFTIAISLAVAGLMTRNICQNAKAALNTAVPMGGVPLQPRDGPPGSVRPEIV